MLSPNQILNSPEWLHFRHCILTRDNHECQSCGRPGGNGVTLHVHHDKSMWKYPHLVFEPWNVRTLCLECHRGVHQGRQFVEFGRQRLKSQQQLRLPLIHSSA